MNCHDCARLADAWLDAELDPATTAEFERHVRACPACARRTEALRALASAVRSADLYARAPAGLQEQVRSALGRERRGQTGLWIGPIRWTAAAAAILLAGTIGWTLHRATLAAPEQLLAQQVMSAHVRSLMAGHLLDVTSSDRHTVKPWFAGKLDFSPDVRDFAAEGFPLAGGRLEYIAGHPAAALVYRHANHTINLFVWPAEQSAPAGGAREVKGYHTLGWSHNGLVYWAVSDTAEDSLRALARCINGETTSMTRP